MRAVSGLTHGVMWLLLAVHVVLAGLFPIRSEDTWWHLAQGRLFATTRSLPGDDPFAFTTAGREWLHHSWLADVFFYLVHAAGGLTGLIVCRIACFLAIAFLLYRLLRQAGLGSPAAFLLVFLSTVALRYRMLIRPELLTYLLLPTMLWVLFQLRSAPGPRRAYLLLPLQVLWVNVHGSWPIGIAIPAIVLASNFLPAQVQRFMTPAWGRLSLERDQRRHLAFAVALLPIACLVNPHGAAMLFFPFRQNRIPELEWFTEWRPLWEITGLLSAWRDVVLPFAVVGGLFVLVSILLWVRERRMDPVGWSILLALGSYALFRSRAVPHFILAILPFLGAALAELPHPGMVRVFGVSRSTWARATAVIAVILMSAAVLARAAGPSRGQVGTGMRTGFFPEGAAAFLEQNHVDGRVFDAHEFGGYLLWRRSPSNQVMIDGRYDGILFDRSVLLDNVAAYRSRRDFDHVTEKYAIDIVVTSAREGRRMVPAADHPGWVRVYRDEVSEVYLRRGPAFAALVARADGERAEALLRLGRWEDARIAARAALDGDPDLIPAHIVLAAAAEELGSWDEARHELGVLLDRLGPAHPQAATIRERLREVERRQGGITIR